MKTRVAAWLVVVVVLWVAVSKGQAASEAAEGIKQGAADAKDKANSWVGWAYQKISQEDGNKADQDETIKMATEREREGMAGAMNKASEQLGKAEEAVGGAIGEAYEKMGMASDGVADSYNDLAQHAKDKYEAAKEKASQAVGDVGAQIRHTNSEL